MKRIVLIVLIMLTACSVTVSPEVEPTPAPTATDPQPIVDPNLSATIEPTATADIEDQPKRFNFLLLGGDFRSHRAGTRYGDKTDVMLLVSIYLAEPAQVTVIQFPRNLYVPVDNFEDMWMFHVYGREGMTGLHYYFQQVFDIDLNGILYVNMDNFIDIVGTLGGIKVDGRLMDGEQALAYLRDNENNWDYGVYDYEGRQFQVAQAIYDRFVDLIEGRDVVKIGQSLWKAYRSKVDTDLSTVDQVYYILTIAQRLIDQQPEIRYLALREPTIKRGDTPLEVRGMIAQADLADWMTYVLLGGNPDDF